MKRESDSWYGRGMVMMARETGTVSPKIIQVLREKFKSLETPTARLTLVLVTVKVVKTF